MKEGLKIVFIIALAIGLLWSCNKTFDETSIISENEVEQLSENELLIRSFLNRMNNIEKTSGEYTVDSAVWYIESTLNYTYSIWDSAFKHQKFDTSFISISLNQNDNIDDSDVSSAYDKLEDSLGVHWDNTPGSTKHVIATDIKVKSNSSGTVVIRLISAIGGGSAPGPYGSFGDDDHWIWGWDEGGCGPNPATSSDASDELVYKYMNPIVTVSNVNRIYFTDVEIHEYVVPGDYVDQNSPCGYRLFEYFQLGTITTEPCIEDDDLDYYLYNGIAYIVNDLEPTGFDLLTIDITDDWVYGSGGEGRRHVLDIWYGEIDQTATGASTPE